MSRSIKSIEAALATARATVAALEAALATEGAAADELLDLSALRERYVLGRAAVLGAVARGELVATRGARGRILVSRDAVEAWLRARPVEVSPRTRADGVVDLAAWEAQQRKARERAGGRR